MRSLISFALLLCFGSASLAQTSGAKEKTFLTRPAEPHVRVMAWNPGSNSIFPDPGGERVKDDAKVAGFRRIVRALDADVSCIQEVFAPRTAAELAALYDDILPLERDQKWQVHGVGDSMIVSRSPLSMPVGANVDYGGGRGPRAHSGALVDLPASFGKQDLYAVCTHFMSRGDPEQIAARQKQAEVIVALMNDLRNPGGEVSLARLTPMVVMGDFNAYKTDPASHMTTLLTGAIADEKLYGKGAPPDWDGTSLADALPKHNGIGPATYTFGDGTGKPFPSAALDRILFTDSVLRMLGGFVLNTTTLTPEQLSKTGLEASDILRNKQFDHFPVVVDFAPRKTGRPN